jgi:hypothetical protein
VGGALGCKKLSEGNLLLAAFIGKQKDCTQSDYQLR